ncbi:TetR/AcrR family transcriptional regulator [Vaginisenegalia massiliensis]|uniref:TetR/AcrR family transcriptional regulator n=1 Tax=Vaginisenegalia massiliensis TaxID=2058294 RepID=UPI000F5445C5|nr:TetR/AcrR family transcriptional regulator [Vaginisenegalia massiliensis]
MQQKRQTLTKQKIKEVLTELITEKGLSAITVSDITRRAGINRGTFYLHYLDKLDLIDQLEQEVIDDLTAILLAESSTNQEEKNLDLFPYPLILQALQYVKSDFEFFNALTNRGRNQAFVEHFKAILGQLIHQKCQTHHIKSIRVHNMPDDYSHELILSHISAIIVLWIRKGAIEPEEDIAHMINDLKSFLPFELEG